MAQILREISEKVHKLVRCVVCYVIPRDLPINGCGNGHVLCHECLFKVLLCPLCRHRVSKNYQNSVLGQIAEIWRCWWVTSPITVWRRPKWLPLPSIGSIGTHTIAWMYCYWNSLSHYHYSTKCKSSMGTHTIVQNVKVLLELSLLLRM